MLQKVEVEKEEKEGEIIGYSDLKVNFAWRNSSICSRSGRQLQI